MVKYTDIESFLLAEQLNNINWQNVLEYVTKKRCRDLHTSVQFTYSNITTRKSQKFNKRCCKTDFTKYNCHKAFYY